MSTLFRLPPPPLLYPHYCRSSSLPPTPPCLHNLTSPSSSAFPDLHFQQTVARIRSFKRFPFNTLVVTCSAASDALLTGFPEEAWPPQSASEPALNQPPASSRKRQEKKRKLIADVDQSELVDPWLLADPDSRFAEYYGVQVHYKIAHPSTEESTAEAFSATEASEVNGSSVSSSKLVEDRPVEPSLQMRIGMPLICLHGFGASVYSWQKVLQPLANCLGSRVVAFDRPAFGLTSRLHPQKSSFRGKEKIFPNPYSLGFSTMLSLAFIEFLKADKAILIGHSAGCIVAAQAYLDAPDRIAAIVMVAPAIIAPFFKQNTGKTDTSKQKDEETSRSNQEIWLHQMAWLKRFFLRLWAAVVWLSRQMVALFHELKATISTFYNELLKAVLRSQPAIWMLRLIMDKYGKWIVRYAWYDQAKVDKRDIEGYTKPLKCRNWEIALLEYVVALVASPMDNKQRMLGKRLADIKCPVLVITGDTDRLVPAFNAKRLASMLPRSQFRLIKNCGHMPHEEKPDEFLAAVKDFVSWVITSDLNFAPVHA